MVMTRSSYVSSECCCTPALALCFSPCGELLSARAIQHVRGGNTPGRASVRDEAICATSVPRHDAGDRSRSHCHVDAGSANRTRTGRSKSGGSALSCRRLAIATVEPVSSSIATSPVLPRTRRVGPPARRAAERPGSPCGPARGSAARPLIVFDGSLSRSREPPSSELIPQDRTLHRESLGRSAGAVRISGR